MIEAMEDVEEEVRVGGELLKNIKFADDQGMDKYKKDQSDESLQEWKQTRRL